MKVIKVFDQNHSDSVNFKKYQEKEKYSFFQNPTDKKIAVVSLNFFDKACYFFQKIFCFCSHPRVKIRNESYQKISSSKLKLLLKVEDQPKNDPNKVFFESCLLGSKKILKKAHINELRYRIDLVKKPGSTAQKLDNILREFRSICNSNLITKDSKQALEEYLNQGGLDYNILLNLITWLPELDL